LNARQIAFEILAAGRKHEAFVGELLDRKLKQHTLTPQDRGLLTTLVYGVLRRRGSLDAILRPFMSRPIAEVDPAVLDVLHLGAFQLAFLTHVPPHAAVYETVSLSAKVTPRAGGFVNGVLRRIAELVTDDFVESPAADALPFEHGKYRKLKQRVLPNPTEQPAAYLADAMSWPGWLALRWLERHGWEQCLALGFHFLTPTDLTLRVNGLWGTREQLVERFAGIACEPGTHPQSLKLTDSPGVRELPGYDEGAFAVQDESAMRVVAALAPEPGWTVLDICSAPGGKTTHVAELMQNRGRIVACDIEADRLNVVRSLAERMRIGIIETYLLDASSPVPELAYDAALVDVPCSNTGVMGKRPEVRWRLTPNDFRHLNRLQEELLGTALDRVKPGGVVVYSTCSIEPDENRRIVRSVVGDREDAEIEDEAESFPGAAGDGGYWARLRKAGA